MAHYAPESLDQNSTRTRRSHHLTVVTPAVRSGKLLDTRVPPDSDAVLVTMRAGGIEARPSTHLLFAAESPVAAQQSDSGFDSGEALEFTGALGAAATTYRALAGSPDADVRAGALVRLGRTLRKMDRPTEALPIYEDLSRLRHARVAGLPADLVGRRAHAALLADLKRADQLRDVARALQADLATRRWPLDRGTFTA